MTVYYLNRTQVNWIKKKLKGYSKNIKGDVTKIYVRDNGGVITRQMELYFLTDKDLETSKCSVSNYGIQWDKPMIFNMLAIAEEMQKQNPSILMDGDFRFSELQEFIKKNQKLNFRKLKYIFN